MVRVDGRRFRAPNLFAGRHVDEHQVVESMNCDAPTVRGERQVERNERLEIAWRQWQRAELLARGGVPDLVIRDGQLAVGREHDLIDVAAIRELTYLVGLYLD